MQANAVAKTMSGRFQKKNLSSLVCGSKGREPFLAGFLQVVGRCGCHSVRAQEPAFMSLRPCSSWSVEFLILAKVLVQHRRMYPTELVPFSGSPS